MTFVLTHPKAELTVPIEVAEQLRGVLENTMREYDVDYVCLREKDAPMPFGVVVPYGAFQALKEAARK